MNKQSCILCNSLHTKILHENLYTYFRCENCKLVFADPAERLSPDQEKKRYDQHENDPNDPDYRDFLNQLFEPLNHLLPSGSTGLDYGSGPGPALSIMFEEAGHTMSIFDPFYDNDTSVLNQTYDFITATETAEHFYNPAREFNKLWSMLKPGGYLGIMTLLLPDTGSFHKWHYTNDDTHVTFYAKNTFRWIAKTFSADLTFHGNRVIIMRKG
jgi:SAM-dependent methyltransferase